MSIIKCHTELEFALIAQQIKSLTLGVQAQILAYSETYANIFIGSITLFPDSMREQITLIRKKYHTQEWYEFLHQHKETLDRINASAIPRTSKEYPPLLKQTSRLPSILYVRGSTELLHMPQIAIVGSRRMTRVGQQNALSWSRFLAHSGFTVTSGLALGVDGAAHQGALQASRGGTIAVMATGIDKIYPKQHRLLAEQIVDSGGCLVTEFQPGTEPFAQHFPQRNRIISGLSLGVLVVEAAVKSGSLITARTALEQNREVFAIPGSIHNAQSKGCHLLIKQGATLVEQAADIVTELAGALAGLRENLHAENIASTPTFDFDEDQRVLLDIIGFDPIDLDTLSRASSWPAEKLSQTLVRLELCHAIDNNNGYYQRLV
jgi:DNA processing protein